MISKGELRNLAIATGAALTLQAATHNAVANPVENAAGTAAIMQPHSIQETHNIYLPQVLRPYYIDEARVPHPITWQGCKDVFQAWPNQPSENHWTLIDDKGNILANENPNSVACEYGRDGKGPRTMIQSHGRIAEIAELDEDGNVTRDLIICSGFYDPGNIRVRVYLDGRSPEQVYRNAKANGLNPIIDASTCGILPLQETPTAVPNTATLIPTDTETLIPTLTSTRTATGTSTSTRTATGTSTNTETPTATLVPTNTETATSTSTRTATGTSTNTRTSTPTSTSTETPTNTSTSTSTATKTSTPTSTRTRTATETPTSTSTKTATATSTNTETSTPTATEQLACGELEHEQTLEGLDGVYRLNGNPYEWLDAAGFRFTSLNLDTARPIEETWAGRQWVSGFVVRNTDNLTFSWPAALTTDLGQNVQGTCEIIGPNSKICTDVVNFDGSATVYGSAENWCDLDALRNATATPTDTATATSTATRTATSTATRTATRTATPTSTSTKTATGTSTPTERPTATAAQLECGNQVHRQTLEGLDDDYRRNNNPLDWLSAANVGYDSLIFETVRPVEETWSGRQWVSGFIISEADNLRLSWPAALSTHLSNYVDGTCIIVGPDSKLCTDVVDFDGSATVYGSAENWCNLDAQRRVGTRTPTPTILQYNPVMNQNADDFVNLRYAAM